MKIAIASDHAGFEQKQKIFEHLIECGHEVIDLGPKDNSRVDYPDFAKSVAQAVSNENVDCGLLLCGTGIGMSICANKIKGVRASNVTNPNFAKLSRVHNNANILCLSGRFVSIETNIECVDVFLETKFEGGRHNERIRKMMELEKC